MQEVTQLPDGVYFIAGTSDSEINTKTYVKYEPGMTDAPIPAKYIGVKLGHRAIAVALEDLPGGVLKQQTRLLPEGHTSPDVSEHYCYDVARGVYRFNAFEDFDGKGNTERLKEYGLGIILPEGEWLPSVGELGLLMMHYTDVCRAIKMAGGKEFWGLYWASTQFTRNRIKRVGVKTSSCDDCRPYDIGSTRVRTVTEF